MHNILYRYRAINKFSLEDLRDNVFYFASPAEFNDPFDCKNLFTFDGSTDNDWRFFLDRLLQRNEPDLTIQERNQKLEKIIQSGIRKDSSQREKLLKIWGESLEEQSNKLGVACLSQKPDDILMWSHYANKHHGFCLKFDKAILESKFFCSKVRYRKKYPTFKEFLKADLVELSYVFLLSKSNHWKYEEEYRLVVDLSKDTDIPFKRKIEYPKEALVGVVWGCQMSKKDKGKIKNSIKDMSHKISFYQAKKSDNSYAITIEEQI